MVGRGGAAVLAAERAAILRALRAAPGQRILDLGTGTGVFARALHAAGARVVGVDQAEAMLREGRRRAPALSFVRGTIDRLPVPDASFDGACAVTVLEFVADPAAVVAEACRVLRPGGRLVVGVLNARSAWALAWRRRADAVLAAAHPFTAPELRALLRPYGACRVRHAVHFSLRPGWLATAGATVDPWLRCLPGGALLVGTVVRPGIDGASAGQRTRRG